MNDLEDNNIAFSPNPMFPETTLFLGNGFDLSLGLKTKYTDYFAYTDSNGKKLWPTKDVVSEEDQLYCRLNNQRVGFGRDGSREIYTWFDLEDEFKKHALRDSPRGIQYVSNYEASFKRDQDYYEEIKRGLLEYLKYEEKRWIENDSPKAHNSPAWELIYQVSKNASPNIITFNYTNVKRLIYHCKEQIFINDDYIQHVHGSLDDEHIILGINEEKGVPKEYDFLFKSWDDYYGSHKVIDTLKSSEIIIFFGLSFGSIDSVYFDDFFKSIIRGAYDKKKKHIVICTYDESSMREIYRQFFIMGISIMELKAHCDFQVMLTNPKDKDNPNKFSGDRLAFLLQQWNNITINLGD